MPPDRPMTTSVNPFLRTKSRVPSTSASQISSTSGIAGADADRGDRRRADPPDSRGERPRRERSSTSAGSRGGHARRRRPGCSRRTEGPGRPRRPSGRPPSSRRRRPARPARRPGSRRRWWPGPGRRGPTRCRGGRLARVVRRRVDVDHERGAAAPRATMGPSGAQASSQIDTPTGRPATSNSWSGSDPGRSTAARRTPSSWAVPLAVHAADCRPRTRPPRCGARRRAGRRSRRTRRCARWRPRPRRARRGCRRRTPACSSRSSGGYPVTASSGKARRSQPVGLGRLHRLTMRATLPGRSPTTMLIWAGPPGGLHPRNLRPARAAESGGRGSPA